ncbi:hypothetical protein B0T16DRAFT_19312 [Cercophora newfieldiana]|uniref:Uncharacterized protein n=1 Tax=Cercophora newfieldiana TaxID=92897 RepID=A0AA40CY80_9PEZI|nr:hypothetical protein B0T16DRAFT_19312 [Cercophora newfieldiana]
MGAGEMMTKYWGQRSPWMNMRPGKTLLPWLWVVEGDTGDEWMGGVRMDGLGNGATVVTECARSGEGRSVAGGRTTSEPPRRERRGNMRKEFDDSGVSSGGVLGDTFGVFTAVSGLGWLELLGSIHNGTCLILNCSRYVLSHFVDVRAGWLQGSRARQVFRSVPRKRVFLSYLSSKGDMQPHHFSARPPQRPDQPTKHTESIPAPFYWAQQQASLSQPGK